MIGISASARAQDTLRSMKDRTRWKARALPLIDIRWKDRVFLNPRDGLGLRVYDEGGLTVSAGVGYVFARDESDGDALRGMGDIDAKPPPPASS